METISKNEGGIMVDARPSQNCMTREQKLLSLRYIGCTGAGTHVFRNPSDPLKLVSMDVAQYREWQMAQKRYGLIDAELCNDVLALQKRIDAIEPGFYPAAWLAARGL